MAHCQTRVCLPCNREYFTKKQGISVVEMASFGPYKIWHADLLECPACGHQIIAGFAQHAFAEHYQADFADVLKQHQAIGNVYLIEEEKVKELDGEK